VHQNLAHPHSPPWLHHSKRHHLDISLDSVQGRVRYTYKALSASLRIFRPICIYCSTSSYRRSIQPFNMSTVQPKGSLGKASGKFSIHEENESERHGRATTSQRASVSLLLGLNIRFSYTMETNCRVTLDRFSIPAVTPLITRLP